MRLAAAALLAASLFISSSTGRSSRFLVRVPPTDLHGRKFDRMPARLKIEGPVDPGSLHVTRYDPSTNRVIEANVPFRFDDGRQAEFFSHYWPGDGRHGGTLVWVHEQDGNQASFYTVTFSPQSSSAGDSFAPRAWIGDGDVEYIERGPFPSVLLARPVAVDWDGDSRIDILVGDELGYVTLYRNRGTPREPAFGLGEPLLVDGKPLKVPWSAAPAVADWNGDGLPDLLVAQEPKGFIHYYQNVGTRTAPKLADRGLLQADGDVLKPPFLPVPEMPPGIFNDAYGSIPAVIDDKGDGRLSLLVGTYITGEIYLYTNVGRNSDGTPKLHFTGPLKADGKVIDVGWNSTPAAADLHSSGRLDLISGSFVVSSTGADRPDLARLHMYLNDGASWHETPFPLEDGPLSGAPYSTAIADLDGDGLLDVLVGLNDGSIVLLKNVGTKTKPLFRRAGVLAGSWVPKRWSFDSIVDFYGDGHPALLQGAEAALRGGTEVMLRIGQDFAKLVPLRTVSGKPLHRPATHGDEWGNAQYYDFGVQGKPDLLLGAVDGTVLLYRNVGTRREPRFADGEEMKLATGAPLVAGIAPGTKVTNFDILQGNRAVPAAADFNGDGETDLIVGNALGQVLYFENVGDNRRPRFAPGREIMKRPGRISLSTVDWNRDGLPDLIVSSAGETGKQIILLLHVPDPRQAEFLPPRELPARTNIPYPQPAALDWNKDGDLDLLVSSSYGFVYFLEGSFIEHSYAEGEIVAPGSRR